MAFQLVYTSAAKLLDAGRSGYGTVARSKSITPLVVSAIERVSQFANQRGLDRHRVIHVHRRITAGSNRFHVLTRIVDAGADYTGRTNHLAHHLVISQEEAARAAARGVTPADVLRQFPWLGRWDENARFFDASEDVTLENFKPDGKDSKRQSWTSVTGNPGHARLLSFDGAPRTGVLIAPEKVDPLVLLAEALSEFGPQSWSRSFTTSLETTDELSDLEWIVTTPVAFPEIQSRCGSRTLLDLTNPGILPLPPAPAIPTPQLAPPSGAPNGPGIYSPPAPDVTTRQQASDPVQVRVAETGARAAAASLRSSNPKEDKKTQIKLMVGLAALIFFAGLIVFLFVRFSNEGETSEGAKIVTEQRSEAPYAGAKNLEYENLKKIPLNDEDANAVVKAGPEWSNFILKSNEELKKLSEQKNPDGLKLSFPDPPETKEATTVVDWMPEFTTLIRNLNQLKSINEGSDWFKKIEESFSGLENLKKYGRLPTWSGDSDEMKRILFSKFAKERLDKILTTPEDGKLAEILSVNDPWQFKKYPERHDLIRLKIKESISQAPANGAEPKLKSLQGVIASNSAFFGDAFDDFNNSIKSKLGSPAEPAVIAPKPFSKDPLEGVTSDQIILASEEDLLSNGKGVYVHLFEAMMKPQRDKNTINIEGLKIITDGIVVDLKRLDLQGGNYFESYNDDKHRRFCKDGKFTMSGAGVKRISINYGGKTATILVDKYFREVFEDKLTFGIVAPSETSAKLAGPLADRMRLVMQDKDRRALIIKTDPLIDRVEWKLQNDEWFASRKPLVRPLLFSSADTDSLIADLKALDTNAKAISKEDNGTNEQKKLKRETNDLLLNLRSSFCIALGGDTLSLELSLESSDLSKPDKRDQVKQVFKRLYPKIERSEFKEDWVKDIADIKRKIGENKIDEVVKANSSSKYSNSKTWDHLATNPTSVIGFVNDLIIKSKNYIREEPLSDVLNKIVSITVVSANGRVLFKAEK